MTADERREANKRLAMLLGWTVVEEISTDELDNGMDYYALFKPNGERVTWQESGLKIGATWNEDEVWQHAPDYFSSLDAEVGS